MRVLLIIPELGKGGAERAISKLSILLAKKYQVYLCVFHAEVEIVYPFGGKLLDLKTPPTHSPLRKLTYIFQRIWAIRQIKKKYRIDYTISFLEGADYLNILSQYRDKVIVSIRGSKLHDAKIRGYLGIIRKKILIPFLYAKANQVVTVSNALKDEMSMMFGIDTKRIVTIYNFYDLSEIEEQSSIALTKEWEEIYKLPVIINVGRLHPQKGQAALLKIFAEVREKVNCRLVIIGDGELRDQLTKTATDLGLNVADQGSADQNADVYFLGYQANPFALIRKATLFTLTSYWEGFPNVLLEAMICGTRVISADCPTGPREILAPSTPIDQYAKEVEETPYGWLMPLPLIEKNDNLSVWSSLIVSLLEKGSKEKTHLTIDYVKNFSEEKVSKQWMDILAN